MVLIWIGALLVIFGVLHFAYQTLWSRRLSDPPRFRGGAKASTLEPPGQGLRFLGIGRNWPGVVLFVLGLILLLLGGMFLSPP